jgi:hypothetical protein
MARSYYLQLPEHLIPQALFSQEVHTRRVSVIFESVSGHTYRVLANDNENIKLYSLNASIGVVADDLEALVKETMSIRAELTGIALHIGAALEVPTAENGKAWASLATAIHDRIHDAIGVTVDVAGSVPSKGN